MKDNSQKGKKITKCPDCGSDELAIRSGELYCKKCGLVIEES